MQIKKKTKKTGVVNIDVNKTDKAGRQNALWRSLAAYEFGVDYSAVRKLLAAGADPNFKNPVLLSFYLFFLFLRV